VTCISKTIINSGQPEESQHHVSFSLNPEGKLSQAVDEFPKQLKACIEALGGHSKH